jgi:hypothetical protein
VNVVIFSPKNGQYSEETDHREWGSTVLVLALLMNLISLLLIGKMKKAVTK